MPPLPSLSEGKLATVTTDALLSQEPDRGGNNQSEPRDRAVKALLAPSRPGFSTTEEIIQAFEEDNEDEAARLVRERGFQWADHVGNREETVLHLAVELDYKQVVVNITQRYKEAVDAWDKYGRTPLHYVSTKPNAAKITQVLLEAGSSVDALDSQNLTPLHTLVWRHKEIESTDARHINPAAVAKHLLDNGAEVNTRDVFGDTPLHDAVRNADKEMMKLLLERGADSECRNFDDKTPQDLVQDFPNSDSDNKAMLDKLLRSINEWDPNDARVVHTIPTDAPTCWGNDIDRGHQKVCEKFNANIRFYYRDKQFSQSWSVPVHKLLHEEDQMASLEDEFVRLASKQLGVDKETVRNRCWRWIHLPVNQMSWVTDLVWRLTESAPDTTHEPMAKLKDQLGDNQTERRKEAWKFLTRNTSQRKGANGVFTRMPHAEDAQKNKARNEVEVESDVASESPEDMSSSTTSSIDSLDRREIWRNSTNFGSDRKISIVVPYIDFETQEYIQHIKKARTLANYKPTKPGFRHKFELEEMSRSYKGLRGLHRSQTLDASYHDTLTVSELIKRVEDQVVLKWFKEAAERKKDVKGDKGQVQGLEEKPQKRPELPPRMSFADAKQTKLKFKADAGKADVGRSIRDASKQAKLLMVHQLWLWKLDKDTIITAFPDRYHRGVEDTLLDTIRQGGVHSYTDPHELIEDILYESVTFLDEFQYAGLGIHVLDIFDSAIAGCSYNEAERFDAFRKSLDPNGIVGKTSDITSEINLISKCKDIRDELHMILRVFEAQQHVVEQFSDLFWPGKSASKLKQAFTDNCGTQRLIERTKELDGHAERTHQALDHLVQIKQAQSSLDEAHSAGQLNKAIWIFTLVTVIFTPLSFMTSLFAIPFTYHPQNSDGEIRVEEGWFTNRMAIGECVSVAVIALAIFISFMAPSPKRAFARLKSSWHIGWKKNCPLDADSGCNDTKPPQHDEDEHSTRHQLAIFISRKIAKRRRVSRGGADNA